MAELDGVRVAVIASDGVEQAELIEPVKALREAGAAADIFGPKPGSIQGFNHMDKGDEIETNGTLDELNAESYDAVLLPGGAMNADFLRVDQRLQRFLRQMDDANKPFAVICHAPWELISSGLARGKRMTSYHTIQDDVRNAGAQWVDEEVVVDRNLVSSRQPSDIPAFNREMIKAFSKTPVGVSS